MSESLRLDQWLWFARVVRTRAMAASLAKSGHVRVNGIRAEKAHKAVKIGDVLTIALERRVRVLAVTDIAERRGGADDAREMYEEQAV